MINREKVIRHIIAEISIAKTCKKDFASVDIDMLSDALELLKERPELVRCKDCKHHGKGTCSAAAGIAYPPPDEWFCADGERGERDAYDNSKR